MATRETPLPSIPDVPEGLDENLAGFLAAIKQRSEIREGGADALDITLIRRDLQKIGIDVRALNKDPSSYVFQNLETGELNDNIILANGKYIRTATVAFPATAVPSADPNTLDDYEEGTHTAVMTCGTSGTISLYANYDLCSYTKIGDLVHIQGTIRIEAVSSPVGNLRISLPFTIADFDEHAAEFAGAIITSGLTLAGDYHTAWGDENIAYFNIYAMRTNNTWTSATANELHATATNNYFRFGFTYKTAT